MKVSDWVRAELRERPATNFRTNKARLPPAHTDKAPSGIHRSENAVERLPMIMRVISLARTPDRLARFRATNPHIPAEHFLAIDGLEVGYTSIDFPLLFSPGAVGCYLSHRECWKAATIGALTVFEDDAVVHHRFDDLSANILAALPQGWHFCLWGWNFDSALMIEPLPGVAGMVIASDQESLRQKIGAYQDTDIRPTALPLARFSGTPAYSISGAGAALLLDLQPPDIVVNFLGKNRANKGLDDTISLATEQINAFVCIPPLVVTQNDHATSTVIPP